MKKLLLLIIVLFAFSGPNLSAQFIEAKINPIGAVFQSPDLSVEYILNRNIGVEAKLGYNWGTITEFSEDVGKRNGYLLGLLTKFYLNPDEDGEGIYAGLYGKYVFRSFLYEETGLDYYDYKKTRLSVGLAGGYKFVAANNIVFDFNVGIGRSRVENKFDSDVPEWFQESIDLLKVNIDFLGTLALGYRFDLSK